MEKYQDALCAVLALLPAWQNLSRQARSSVLISASSLRLPPECPAPITAEIRAAGWLDPGSSEKAPRLGQAIRPLRWYFDMLMRHSLFKKPGAVELSDYLLDTFSSTDLDVLRLSVQYWGSNFMELSEIIADKDWLMDFLHLKKWPVPQKDIYAFRSIFPRAPAAPLPLLQDLCRQLLNGESPVPWSHFLPLWQQEPATWAELLHYGLKRGLLFASMDGEALEPLLGIWPEIHRRHHLPPIPQPSPVEAPAPAEVHASPYLLEDMTTLLVAAGGQGLRLTANNQFFRKVQAELVQALAPLPAFVPLQAERRMAMAFEWLQALKFIKHRHAPHAGHAAHITSAGEQWLQLDAPQRLRLLLDALLQNKFKDLGSTMGYQQRLSWHAVERPFMPADFIEMLCAGIEEAFSMEPHIWVPLEAWLDWRASEKNPLKNKRPRKQTDLFSSGYGGPPLREEDWRPCLHDFFMRRLLALGGAQAATDAGGHTRFCLTEIGAYYLGRSQTFTWAPPAAGQVIIQPDFEIIFTGANPAAENELARFAERKGHRTGVLFRLTRESIFAARRRGVTPAVLIEQLEGLSSKHLPANVRSQVLDWANSYRSVQHRRAWLLECPDKTTAARIRAALPRGIIRLTDTLLELNPQAGDLKTLTKRLAKEGIGLQTKPALGVEAENL